MKLKQLIFDQYYKTSPNKRLAKVAVFVLRIKLFSKFEFLASLKFCGKTASRY